LPAPYPGDVNTTRSKAGAVFGDTSHKVTDRLTLGTGVRYFEDSQVYTSGSTQTGKFHSIDPRFYARYKLADTVNVYSSAAKGFRSGGFNLLNQPSYGPESVWTYELGTKMSLLEGRLSADAAVFYSRYTNYQIVGVLPPPEPPLDITSNAGSAKIDGIEWDLTWRPADQWSLSFNGDYLHDYKFTEISVTNSSYQVGDNLDFVSRYAFTTSAERDFIWHGKSGFVRLDYNEVGRENFRNRSLGYWYFSQSDVSHMLNFNSSLCWNDILRFGVFAQNLLNDRGYISPDVIEADASRSRPRTVGIQFSVTFR
jgi:outer membrane receptor protein involved in Fe transport